MKSIHIDNIKIMPENCKMVSLKRERKVFCDNKYYIKIWVKNWTQSLCTLEGIKRGFYDENVCPALCMLIHDETGPRGYIMHKGEKLLQYKDIVEKVKFKDRVFFVKSIVKNAIKSKGIFHDFSTKNIILYDDGVRKNPVLSLIDLDAFRSFSLIFNKQKEDFEKFELDVRWKPYEAAHRDVTERFPEMVAALLERNQKDFEITDASSFEKILNIIDSIEK